MPCRQSTQRRRQTSAHPAPSKRQLKPNNPLQTAKEKFMSERKRRNPVAATLLSIFIPGLGQIYNGEINRALTLYTALLLLPLLLVATGSHRRFEGAAFLAAS